MNEIVLEQISNDSLGLNRQIITRDAETNEVRVLVDLSASVNSGNTTQQLNYNINIINVELVTANAEKVQAEVDKFVASVRVQAEAICPIVI